MASGQAQPTHPAEPEAPFPRQAGPGGCGLWLALGRCVGTVGVLGGGESLAPTGHLDGVLRPPLRWCLSWETAEGSSWSHCPGGRTCLCPRPCSELPRRQALPLPALALDLGGGHRFFCLLSGSSREEPVRPRGQSSSSVHLCLQPLEASDAHDTAEPRPSAQTTGHQGTVPRLGQEAGEPLGCICPTPGLSPGPCVATPRPHSPTCPQ